MGKLIAGRAAIAAAASAFCPDGFVVVPATVLPCGIAVPPFAVARWLAARGVNDTVLLSETAPPWVGVSYRAARAACVRSGLCLLSELQALALAWNLARQAVNWTGGAVGAGKLFQGLHLASVAAPQPACATPPDPRERRWHALSNGARIVDAAGNAFSWVFDDAEGDAEGLVAREFTGASPALSTPPGAPWQQGLGWWPHAGRRWLGRALARGGAWSSQDGAGMFTVIDERPHAERPYIGFRCTLPL